MNYFKGYLSVQTYLNLCLLSRLFLLSSILLLVVSLVGEIDLDAECVPELVNCRSMRADNTAYEVPDDLKFGRLKFFFQSSQ